MEIWIITGLVLLFCVLHMVRVFLMWPLIEKALKEEIDN